MSSLFAHERLLAAFGASLRVDVLSETLELVVLDRGLGWLIDPFLTNSAVHS